MPGEAHQYLSSSGASHGYGVAKPLGLEVPRRESMHAVPHEKYKGIRYRPELGRYISEIRPAQPRKRKIWLGTYKTAEEAARAFDAGIFYTKKSIEYNFEDSPTILEPLPANLSPEEEHVEIQKKAKAAAARASPADANEHETMDTNEHYQRYHHYHYLNQERGEPCYQRHIPQEIQFSAVLNRG